MEVRRVPSTTYFNLSEEKREKIMTAARAEFARVPYPDASINKIIQAADIPRGSFYMYFKDKEELFVYLMSSYAEGLSSLMKDLLVEHHGDLFAVFPALVEVFRQLYQDAADGGGVRELMDIFRNNAGMRLASMVDPEGMGKRLLEELTPYIDLEALDLRTETDLSDMFLLLLGAMGPALSGSSSFHGTQPVQTRYLRVLDILKRGMAKR